jgi:hypothetical protein
MAQVIQVEMFESRMDVQARRKPASMARLERSPGAQLLAHALKDEDVGVHRHAHREQEAGDPGKVRVTGISLNSASVSRA